MTHKPEFDIKAKRPAHGAAAPPVASQTKEEKIVHHHGPGVMRAAP